MADQSNVNLCLRWTLVITFLYSLDLFDLMLIDSTFLKHVITESLHNLLIYFVWWSTFRSLLIDPFIQIQNHNFTMHNVLGELNNKPWCICSYAENHTVGRFPLICFFLLFSQYAVHLNTLCLMVCPSFKWCFISYATLVDSRLLSFTLLSQLSNDDTFQHQVFDQLLEQLDLC